MVYETHAGMYQFEHLPKFTAFILDGRLEAYTKDLIAIYYRIDVPILKFFTHFTEEQILQTSIDSNREFLTYLSQDKAKEFMAESISRWQQNQLPFVDKYGIEARDITLINYARARNLKKWIRQYTDDIELIIALNGEIDDLMLGYITSATDTYINILKEKIARETKFSTNLVAASPSIVFIYDIESGKEVYINERVQEVVGYTPEEIMNTPDLINSLTHPEDIPVLFAFLERVVSDKDGHPHYAQYRLRNKKGDYQWLRCYAVVFESDKNGKATKILGAAFDITKEKEISEALERSEQQLLDAQEIARLGSFEWDVVNDTSISSPQLRKIFEVDYRQTLDEMLQKVHPDDKHKVTSALQVSFQSGEFACEFRYIAPSGEKIIDARGLVSFADGKAVRMVGTVQDITDRKRIEVSLIQKTIELQRSNEQLQEFAHVASHDLREPLRKISMFTNIILTSDWESLPEKTKANLQKISDSSVRMQGLIDDILAYSSVSAPTQKVFYSLEEGLKAAIENLESRIADTGATVSSDGLPETNVIPFQIQQLFQNLIANAVKFAKADEPPKISIVHSIRTREEVNELLLQPSKFYLEIQVRDNGIGFNDRAREKIFGLFQRLHTRAAYEGSGLGLAICKRIMENHGGIITAQSTERVGSTFTLLFPFDKK